MSQLSAEGNRIDTIDLKNCPGLRKCLKLKQVTGRKVVQWGEEEDGDFEDGILYIGNMELLGEGYTIKIAAEIVPVCDFEDPLAAFYSAEH